MEGSRVSEIVKGPRQAVSQYPQYAGVGGAKDWGEGSRKGG